MVSENKPEVKHAIFPFMWEDEDGPSSWESRCECGWTSPEYPTEAAARHAGYDHLITTDLESWAAFCVQHDEMVKRHGKCRAWNCGGPALYEADGEALCQSHFRARVEPAIRSL